MDGAAHYLALGAWGPFWLTSRDATPSPGPPDEAAAPIVTAMYDFMFGPGRDPVTDPGTATGTPGDWWTTFALVPDVLEHCVAGFALYRSPQRPLPAELRELGRSAPAGPGSQFVFSQHCQVVPGPGHGRGEDRRHPHWPVADCWSPVERAVLAYTDALVLEGGRVSDGVFAALRAHLDDEQILELTYITCLYEMHAIASRALRTEWDDRDEPVVEVPGDHASLAPEVGRT